MTRLLFSLSLVCTTAALVLSPLAAEEKSEKSEPTRILFVTESKGFVHGSVKRDPKASGELAPAEVAMIQLGQQSGLFDCDCTQDAASDFTKENLKNYDIVAFYTTGELPITDEDRDYFVNEWLKTKGHGWIGFHSAADTYRTDNPDHQWYWDICGGTFIGHPWNANSHCTMAVHDPEHPAAKPFGTEFKVQDEIYMYNHWNPENVRVLMSLDYAGSPTPNTVNAAFGTHVPVAWVRSWGDGKIYFNNLGHREDTWTNPAFLDSIKGAVKWIRGEVEGSSEPNPEVSQKWEAKSRKDIREHGFKVENLQ
ncbi:MAG: ThuA domain-containing protein [Planctomycetaceae bacterium]|nr:ThuA domain-containing protein [Planctomycetaceae bacterium]